MKKFLKVFLIILLLLLIVVLVFLGIFAKLTLEKVAILNEIEEKMLPYLEKENVAFSQEKDGVLIEYFKNEKFYKKETSLTEEFKITEIASSEKMITLTQNGSEREVIENEMDEINFEKIKDSFMNNVLDIGNDFSKFLYASKIKVYDSELLVDDYNSSGDKISCYVIEGFYNPYFLYDEKAKNAMLYFDKETGLLLQFTEVIENSEVEGSGEDIIGEITTITKYRYKFDELTDEDFSIKIDLM